MRRYTVDSEEDNPITISVLLYQQGAVHLSLDAVYLDVETMFMTIVEDNKIRRNEGFRI
jgi:predicted HTH domain antitoxin